MLSLLNSTIALVAVIISFILYALVHIPVYVLYKRWGYDKAWMAFFIFLHPYAIAEISDLYNAGRVSILGISVSRRLLGVVLCVVNFLPIIGKSYGFIVSFIIDALLFGSLFRDMYAKIDNKSVNDTKLLGILSGFFYIIYWFKCVSWLNSNK